ncbi:MAG: AraC family transcriptional regulator [Prevotella sp.]|nr:AraC family transcriptional regulator [Prevotella sp.]
MEENTNSSNTPPETSHTFDNKVALISDFNQIGNMPETKFQLEGYLFIIILSGELRLTIDESEYVLSSGDLFSCMPRNVLEHPSSSEDLDARVIYLSRDFAEDVSSKIHIDWTFSMMVNRHEIIHASPADIQLLLRYFDLAKTRFSVPPTAYKRHSVEMLFASMLYVLFDIRSNAGLQLPPRMGYSAAENLLQRFVKLLNESGHKVRSVNEYAALLCVSSKYFSSVCKQLTGKSASALINDDIVRSAQLMLKDHGMSLKQIADALHFKNQSHFGTFFRRHVGMSPQQYRDAGCGRGHGKD